MGLFSSRAEGRPDERDREYVLTACPLIASDRLVVVVDLTVRLTVRREPDGVLGYDPKHEGAVHAVVVLVLRQLAERLASEELLSGRSAVVHAVEHGLALATVPAGVDARVSEVEVRRFAGEDPRDFRYEFRLAPRKT